MELFILLLALIGFYRVIGTFLILLAAIWLFTDPVGQSLLVVVGAGLIILMAFGAAALWLETRRAARELRVAQWRAKAQQRTAKAAARNIEDKRNGAIDIAAKAATARQNALNDRRSRSFKG